MTTKHPKVVIVHGYIAHYHAAVLRNLMRERDICYSIYAGVTSGEIPLKVLSSNEDQRAANLPFTIVENSWLTGRVLWQSTISQLAIDKSVAVVIHPGNAYYISTWVGAILGRLSGQVVLMWTHGLLERERGLKKFVRLTFYRIANGLLLYEKRAKQLLVEEGFRPDSMTVVYNSMDYSVQKATRTRITPKKLDMLREKWSLRKSVPLIVFIGRLTQQKRLHLLLEAVFALKRKHMEIDVAFLGDGSERGRLEDLVRTWGLESVHFVGSVYDENEIAPWLYMADLTVSPGEVGLTAMHSFAYGTPVVTHGNFDRQMPEVEAITPGITGDFFRDGDACDLAAVLQRWFAGTRDRELVRQACIRVIESKYNPESQVVIINNTIKKYFERSSECNF